MVSGVPSDNFWNRSRLAWREWAEARIFDRRKRFQRAMTMLNEERVMREGLWRAHLAAWRAWRNVPAYREFLQSQGIVRPDVPLEQLPVMDKNNYVRAFPTEKRCIGGSYLRAGVAIDESSGSTGIPYNWVRGIPERRRSRRELARMIEWVLGERPRIAINAFSMGAWATGVNMGEALELHSVIKSTGPDLEKILHTLQFFGPAPGYFMCGYPPFLKLVLDSMLQRGFPVADYELHALVGGEGMSEEFRRYLLKHFRTCHSGYGASDLEMGIAVETAESIRIRGLLHDDATVRVALLDGDHRVPMVFQYNPLCHHLEANERGELIVTLNYSRILSPRVRYNIGDEARLMTREALLAKLSDLGRPVREEQYAVRLPYLFLFGRRDQTISIMGANIYPEDVERVLFAQPELAGGMASFSITLEDRGEGAVFPKICVEWLTGEAPVIDKAQMARRIKEGLMAINSDFRNAVSEYSGALDIEFELHCFGQGPFAGRGNRIKNRYLGKMA